MSHGSAPSSGQTTGFRHHPLQESGSGSVGILLHYPPVRRGANMTRETEYLIKIKKVAVSIEVHQRINRKWHHSCGQRVVKNSFTCTLTKHGWRIYFWLSSWRWIQLPKQCSEYRLHSFTAQLWMCLCRPTRIF